MPSDKQKIILICTLYNVLLEFWVWGVGGFMTIVLPVSVFFMYLFYFCMLEDLIVRFKLRDYQVLLFGFLYGLFQESFNTGSTFNDPHFFGVNVFNIFMANVLWWGILQSVLALYFSNRIVDANQGEFGKMGPVGWIFSLGFNLLLLFGVVFEGLLPEAPAYSYYIIIVLMMGVALLFIISVIRNRDQEAIKIEKMGNIDAVIRLQLILCFIMGAVLRFFIGDLVHYLFILWSVFTGILYFFSIAKGKRFVGISER